MIKRHTLIGFAAVAALFLLLSCKNNLLTKNQKEKSGEIPVKSIRLLSNENELSLVKRTAYPITAQIIPKNATNKTLLYSSTDSKIAAVDSTGFITANKEGLTVITVETLNGVKKTISVTVTTEPVPVENIEIPEDFPKKLYIGGGTLNLNDIIKVKPDTATEDKTLTYSTTTPELIDIIDMDGTVQAKKDGMASITVTVKAHPTVAKTVTIEIKKKPEIRYESVQAIQPESAGGICTFTIKTLIGKLDYEPRFTSNNIPWITGSPTISSRTDTDQDTILFTCKENKSVWDRRAYIRFWDKTTNSYVKNGDGKELTVNIIQKRNNNPALIHYKWVKGINAPTADQKEIMPIIYNSNPTGYYYEQPYVFKWNETTDTNFYNARKLSKLRKNGFPNDYFVIEGIDNKKKQGTDLSQCWAKTAANMLHWWFEQNKGYIDKYTQKASIEDWKRPLYKHDYIRSLTDKDEGKKSDIANIFRVYTHDKSYGGYIEDGLTWYLYERDGQKTLGSIYPGLFNDVFTFDTRPINTERCETKKEFEKIMNEAFDKGRAIGLFWKGNKGRLYQHAVTCWGAAYDGEDNIICLYIAESNLTEAALYPYGVQYRGNIYDEPAENRTYMYNYYLSKPEDIYVDSITTLDLGEARWQEWFEAHQ